MLEVDLRTGSPNELECSATRICDIVFGNRKEYWCNPYIDLGNNKRYDPGQIKVDRDSPIGEKIKRYLKVELPDPEPQLNEYLLSVLIQNANISGIINLFSFIHEMGIEEGIYSIRTDLKKVLGIY